MPLQTYRLVRPCHRAQAPYGAKQLFCVACFLQAALLFWSKEYYRELLRLLFVQAHLRETESKFTAIGRDRGALDCHWNANTDNFRFRRAAFCESSRTKEECRANAKLYSDKFRFRRAAFYQGLKSKVGLAAAKAAAFNLRTTLRSGPAAHPENIFSEVVWNALQAPCVCSFLLQDLSQSCVDWRGGTVEDVCFEGTLPLP